MDFFKKSFRYYEKVVILSQLQYSTLHQQSWSAVHFILTFKIKVMNIERPEFIAWMERIMERFDLLREHIISKQSKYIEIDGEQLLDNQDVLQLLKISSRSLQRYRTDKKLPYYTISGKLYYKLSDVHQLIRNSLNSKIT